MKNHPHFQQLSSAPARAPASALRDAQQAMEAEKDGDGKPLITAITPTGNVLPPLDDSDDRRRCLTCTGLRGNHWRGWQCSRYRDAIVCRDLPPALVELPQRCPAYIEISPAGPKADDL